MKNNQKGFGVVEYLIVLVIVVIVGSVGWYIWKNHSFENNVTQKNSAASTKQIVPGATWKTYINSSYKYSLKYPAAWLITDKGCTLGIVLLGPTKTTVGVCGSENFGEVSITAEPTSQYACQNLDNSSYGSITTESVKISGIEGTKQTAVSKAPNGTDMFALPEGTKTVTYCVQHNGNTYIADYVQVPTAPNVLSQFNIIIDSIKIER